ncbi:MAG: hypothetical protein LAP40_16065 [Acidobacteriia bacterium]|nr:hypothetical protein [Terriglobia bacterium]
MPQLTTKDRLAKHDREVAAIRKLVLTGTKMRNSMMESQRRLAASQRELAASQRETGRQLQVLVRSLQRGSNGHGKPPIAG